MFSNYHSHSLNPLINYTVLDHKRTSFSSLWLEKKQYFTTRLDILILIILWVLLLMIKMRDATHKSYFWPSSSFIYIIKPHHTDAQCEKLNGKRFLQSYRKGCSVGQDFWPVTAVIHSSPHFLRHTTPLPYPVQN